MAVKDKNILKEITRRWVKGFVESGSVVDSFSDMGFTDDEIEYMEAEMHKIADRITPKEHANSVDALVKEYFDFN